MTLATHALRRLSLGALLAALVLAGLAAAPAAAQNRRAVSPQRGQYLVWRYRQYGQKKVRIAAEYRAIKAWCDRNWRLSHTRQYRSYQARMKNLKVQYNWARHYMNQIQAEYHGRRHGWVAGGGMNTGRNRPSTGGLLGVRPTRSTASSTRTTRTTRSTGSTPAGAPSYGGLNLLNQRVRNPVRGR